MPKRKELYVGANSKIEWCTHTFSPWWGCLRASPACEHCYAETFAKRIGYGSTKPAIWGPEQTTERRFFGDAHWREPLRWNEKAKDAPSRPRVFCASMSDVFEDREDLYTPRARLFELIEATPNLDWLLLTKRPENMIPLSPVRWHSWPDNVWAGTTAEDQEWADKRIPQLVKVPAMVRFLSCEPLLGPIDLSKWLPFYTMSPPGPNTAKAAISWVIGGGESAGPKGRRLVEPCGYGKGDGWCLASQEPRSNREGGCALCENTHLWPKTAAITWARSLRDQCQAAGIAWFWKQWGGPTPKAGGRLLDGRTWDEMPTTPAREAVPA